MVSLAWLSKDGYSLLIPITAVKAKGEYNVKFDLDISRYGMSSLGQKFFTVWAIPAQDGQVSENLGSFIGREIKIDVLLNGRDIKILEIRLQED